MSSGPAALARCVGDPGAFLARDWARHVHHRQGGDFADLLSLDDVDHIITGTALRVPAFRLVRAGRPLPPARYTRSARVGSRPIDDLIDVGRVLHEFDAGATIVLQGLHRSWPPLADFCRSLEHDLTHPVQANAYLTPPVASGLKVHADPHDVFALQTHGRKHWVTYPADADIDDPGAPDLDLHLEAGDSLYVPRGTPHAARTVEEPSLHITIGVRAVTWHAVISRLVDRAGAEGLLDEPLPARWAHDPDRLASSLSERLGAAADWLRERDAEGVGRAAARRFWTSRAPALSGQLRQLLRLPSVDDTTVVRRRSGATAHLDGVGDGLVLALSDRDLHLPRHSEPAVRSILDRGELAVGDLAEHLDEQGRAVLARRLVREGLLEIVG